MAHCVISAIVDTAEEPYELAPACVVHTTWAPCPHDGEPACETPLHSMPGTTRSEALHMWQVRTHRQRPFVIHRVDGRAAEEHDIDSPDCPCGPELLAAEESANA